MLPLQAMTETHVYHDLVVDIAKAIYRRKHINTDDASRLPKVPSDFAKSYSPVFVPKSGSLVLEWGLHKGDLFQEEDEFDEATLVLNQMLSILASDEDISPFDTRHITEMCEDLPGFKLENLSRLGKTFTSDQFMHIQDYQINRCVLKRGSSESIKRNASRIQPFQLSVTTVYSEPVFLIGKIVKIDGVSKIFTLEDSTTQKEYKGPFDAQSQFEWLREHLTLHGGSHKDVALAALTDKSTKGSRKGDWQVFPYALMDASVQETQPIITRLHQLGTLQDGWLDGSGKSLNQLSLRTATKTLYQIITNRIELPKIFPIEDGGISLEWERYPFNTDVSINGLDRKIAYSAWDNYYDDQTYETYQFHDVDDGATHIINLIQSLSYN